MLARRFGFIPGRLRRSDSCEPDTDCVFAVQLAMAGSTILQIPNLASRASEVVRRTLQKLLLGMNSAAPVEAGTRRRTLLLYGLAAAGWKSGPSSQQAAMRNHGRFSISIFQY